MTMEAFRQSIYDADSPEAIYELIRAQEQG